MRTFFAFAILSSLMFTGCESLEEDRRPPLGGPEEDAKIAAAPPVQRDINSAASARHESAAAIRAETRVR